MANLALIDGLRSTPSFRGGTGTFPQRRRAGSERRARKRRAMGMASAQHTSTHMTTLPQVTHMMPHLVLWRLTLERSRCSPQHCFTFWTYTYCALYSVLVATCAFSTKGLQLVPFMTLCFLTRLLSNCVIRLLCRLWDNSNTRKVIDARCRCLRLHFALRNECLGKVGDFGIILLPLGDLTSAREFGLFLLKT